jgi:hypothetical protein
MTDIVKPITNPEGKRSYKVLYKKIKNAIERGETETEQKLLWTCVAMLELSNRDWEEAQKMHPEITKLSELYNHIEMLGRLRGLIQRKEDGNLLE